ncbi:MAG: T9SS type A sorting domain-containing protein [Bacteroidetes bacterium]|nr:T9SS type A sorting domain-containing protein [Bacteroidota bacterium]
MKKLYLFCISALMLTLTTNLTNAQTEADSITMGASYANDVYYSFADGEILSVDRSNWDIGFYTLTWSAGVIVNDGKGIELRVYPFADTNGWNAIDTTGLSAYPILYNSVESWEEGAFNVGSTGHPDYGWGKYNTITHSVVGDSIYIIKLADGTLKKFWIIQKISTENIYQFRYANLDGSNEMNVTLDCNDYTDKNFVYYSIESDEVLDREPNSDTWDVLFTKYMGVLDGGVRYPVTGVLNNVDVPANRFDMVAPDFVDWTAAPMDSTKAPIGHDWKYFDMNQFTYVVEDSLVFFVRNFNKDVYKLVFSSFDYTVGKAVFDKSMVHASSVSEVSQNHQFVVFPNPATDFVNIKPVNGFEGGEVLITDFSGRTVYKGSMGTENTRIALDRMKSGMYMITIYSGSETAVQKLLIN